MTYLHYVHRFFFYIIFVSIKITFINNWKFTNVWLEKNNYPAVVTRICLITDDTYLYNTKKNGFRDQEEVIDRL